MFLTCLYVHTPIVNFHVLAAFDFDSQRSWELLWHLFQESYPWHTFLAQLVFATNYSCCPIKTIHNGSNPKYVLISLMKVPRCGIIGWHGKWLFMRNFLNVFQNVTFLFLLEMQESSSSGCLPALCMAVLLLFVCLFLSLWSF